MKKILKLGVLWLSLVQAVFALDTLEIFAMRVQFREEKPDNSLTTGTGLFDSGERDENYSLDPNGRRGTVAYWRKHFEFAQAYYQAASNGKVFIKYRIFPENGEMAYTLDKYIIDYNRTAKRDDEKVAEYDEARSRDYMTFIFDAVQKAHASSDSPFKIPLPENSNTKRAYMIIHAGASRLVDGGTLGTTGADTPGDFTDVYVTPDYWTFLPPDSVGLSEKDSVRGIPLANAVLDTLKEMMVVSETASQNGLNWGINGIMVNQIGRALGMPNTYDIVKGISRLGYFDVMDFAGYSAGNGFFPVLPSAWLRAYMGWVPVKTINAKAGHSVDVELSAAGSGIGTEIVKIPLSANEYLLIENRVRSLSERGEVEIQLGSDEDDAEKISKKIPVDSLSLVFQDSICHKGKCSANKRKAKGIILNTSSFDAAIPASGITVWKVNEWYLKESLPYGTTNFWGGDTLKDHQFGLSLVEADGILTLGKTFKNALGQNAYDYGSGADLLPHVRVAKDTSFDTVFTIKPSGYGNTATTQGGYSGVSVRVHLPSKFRREKTANTFIGDSVITFSAEKMRVTVRFEDFSLPGGDFPKAVGLRTAPRAAVFMDYPSGSVYSGEKMIVFGSEEGTLQALSAYGNNLFDSDTSVAHKILSQKDSVESVPLYRLGQSFGHLIGMASVGSNLFSLHENVLVHTKLKASLDLILSEQKTLSVKQAIAGPMIQDSLVWVLEKNKLTGFEIAASSKKWNKKSEMILPSDFEATDFAYCPDGVKADNRRFAVVGKNGTFALVSSNKTTQKFSLPTAAKDLEPIRGQQLKVICSDFDRDEIVEAFVIGSRGYGAFVKLQDSLELTDVPRQYRRGGNAEEERYEEISRPVVSDIDGDGYPEAVFLGHNKLYAVDVHGVVLPGFPATFSRGVPETDFGSEPLIFDIIGDSLPEILAPASSGLLYAFNSKGKAVGGHFPLSAGTFEYEETVAPLSIFAGNTIDSLKGVELYAFQREYMNAFKISEKSVQKNSWTLPGNGNARTAFFDASLLSKPSATKAKQEITEFFIYPNPVRNGNAKSRFTIGADAEYAELEVFDITGLCVLKKKMAQPKQGRNQWDALDFSHLGSDVYSVRLKVKFTGGKTKQKFYRIGVVR